MIHRVVHACRALKAEALNGRVKSDDRLPVVGRNRNPAWIIKQLPVLANQTQSQNSEYWMGFLAVEALCDCNATSSAPSQPVGCYISARDILPSCKPILKATARGRCGIRRMIISTFLLLLILVAIYCLSISCERVRTFGRSLRNQIQSPARNQPQISPPPAAEELRGSAQGRLPIEEET